MNKEGSFKPVIITLVISMIIALFWNNLTFLKNFLHAILDPSAGAMIIWNVNIGMLLLVAFLTFITTLVQKYTTDQETLKELKEKQKEINKRSKEHRHDPEKMMEIQKELGPIAMQTFKLSLRAFTYTSIPLILFFRWFMDFFDSIGNPKLLGFMGWLIFYLIFSIIFSSIFRKILKVA